VFVFLDSLRKTRLRVEHIFIGIRIVFDLFSRICLADHLKLRQRLQVVHNPDHEYELFDIRVDKVLKRIFYKNSVMNGVDNKRLGLDIRQFDCDRVLNVGQKCAGVIVEPLKAEKLGIDFGYDF
jgi:hypothetical protein